MISYLIAAFGALLGYSIYQTVRARGAEALNQNLDTKEKLLENDKNIAQNNGQLASEEEKRNEEKQPIKPVDNDGLTDFFNNSDKK